MAIAASIIAVLAVMLFASVAAFFVFRQNKIRVAELVEFRESVRSVLEKNSESLREEVRHLQNKVGGEIKNQADVLRETGSELNKRMDKAAQVITEVNKELGKMSNVARSIDDLQNILKAPKLRGGFGELFLGDLLSQILPHELFELQYRFKGGDIVDAVIRVGEKMVPIDSKFPLENFQRIMAGGEDEPTKQLRRQFINDVKRHIQGVEKYIRTDEGTYNFALMYIPAENIYYEIAVKEDVGGEAREVLNYALQRKVVPVSPNTLYAYLMTIIIGLRGLQIEKNAGEMIDRMGRVHKDFINFQRVYSKLGNHLDNAKKSYEDADRRLAKVDSRMQDFLPPSEAVPQIENGIMEADDEISPVQ